MNTPERKSETGAQTDVLHDKGHAVACVHSSLCVCASGAVIKIDKVEVEVKETLSL